MRKSHYFLLLILMLLVFLFHVRDRILLRGRGYIREFEPVLHEFNEKRTGLRRPLRGEPVVGNAMDLYLDAARGLEIPDATLLRKIEQAVDATAAVTFDPLLLMAMDQNSAMIKLLRKGVRRERCTGLPLSLEIPHEPESEPLPEGEEYAPEKIPIHKKFDILEDRCQWLAALSILEGRKLSQEGKTLEGVETILDAARFGQDIRRSAWNSQVQYEGDLAELDALYAFLSVVSRANLRSWEVDPLQKELRILAEGELSVAQSFLAERLYHEVNFANPSVSKLGALYRYPLGIDAWCRFRPSADALEKHLDLLFPEMSREFQTIREETPCCCVNFPFEALDRLEDAVARTTEIRGHMAAAVLTLAIRKYALNTGKMPEKLENLVPSVLGRLPQDPFSAEPMGCKKLPEGKGIRLYSVGPNGKDDGGEGDDIGFPEIPLAP
jgi:hypothetical protein